MPLRYLLDENVSRVLSKAIERHNVRTAWWPQDVIRIGDSADLPLGIKDPVILIWAEREERIFISGDRRTLPRHLTAHIASGHRCPGIFIIRYAPVKDILDFLVCAAYASEPSEWENQITFIP
jgi:hypothetical protein